MLIFQKVKNGGMSICVNCSHRKVCKGIDNQPCVECNQFFNEDKQPQTNADHLWIPVTERLPEKGDKYLCIVKSCLFRGATYQTILGYDKGGFYDGCICMEDVTHWMPLPEAPDGDE